MTRTFKSLAAVTAVGLIAGCGGGSSTPISPVKQPSGSAPATANGKTRGAMTLVIRSRKDAKQVSLGKRKPLYVSPATSGILATFNDTTPAPGTPANPATTYQGYALAPGAAETATSPASCTALQSDGSYTCTLFFALTAGQQYTTTLTAYDNAQSGTTSTVASPAMPAPAANALSTDTQTFTISPNTSNTFAFALQGIVEGFNVTPQYVGANGTAVADSLTSKFTALDADFFQIDKVDTATNFAVGTQNAGPFSENASFAVGAVDESTCTTAPCLTTASTAVTNPASETVTYSYNGMGDPGDPSATPAQAPYYGVITLTGPEGYGGFQSGPIASGSSATYAGTLYLVPIFGYVSATTTTGGATATGAAVVAFSGPSQSITGYATQYHLATNAPQDGSGYTVDASNCASGGSDANGNPGAIATVGPTTYTAGLGIAFTISSTAFGGSCTLTVHDGSSPDDTSSIAVSSSNTGTPVTVSSPGPRYSPNARKR